MTLAVTLVGVVALASLASTITVRTLTPEAVDGSAPKDDYKPSDSASDAQTPDSYQLYPHQPSFDFELPKVEQNPVPFQALEPLSYLTAPPQSQEPNYYSIRLPFEELDPPAETEWNPENDPKFYYEVPASLTKQDFPTYTFPKKYNKDIHSKNKPSSSKPKQEIVLEPIDEKQYVAKQKDLHKIFQHAAKKNNQKQIEEAQVKKQQEPDQKLTAPVNNSHDDPSSGERIDFHMVGHDGPDSYKWGFDTGKGRNRQFRYEEKDKTGLVKGNYGFYDKNGNLQIVHYDSSPNQGFRAEGNFGIV